MPDKPHPVTDLRALRRKDERRLIVIIAIFLVVVGGIVIGLVYGWQQAAMGGACLLVGAAVLGLLWLILSLVERWANRE